MTLQEYIKKAYNLNEDEYTLEERKEQSECICGKRYHWIDMHYTKKLARPRIAGGRTEVPMTRTFIKEWINCHCSCGLTWDEHPKGVSVNDMKGRCASCGEGIELDHVRYERQGNHCNPCEKRHQAQSEVALKDKTYPQEDPMHHLLSVLD